MKHSFSASQKLQEKHRGQYFIASGRFITSKHAARACFEVRLFSSPTAPSSPSASAARQKQQRTCRTRPRPCVRFLQRTKRPKSPKPACPRWRRVNPLACCHVINSLPERLTSTENMAPHDIQQHATFGVDLQTPPDSLSAEDSHGPHSGEVSCPGSDFFLK